MTSDEPKKQSFETMHELLEAGLQDLEITRQTPGHKIYMYAWFSEFFDPEAKTVRCRVCLAGALMLQRLMQNEVVGTVWRESLRRFHYAQPTDLDEAAFALPEDESHRASVQTLREASRYMRTLDVLRRAAVGHAVTLFYDDTSDSDKAQRVTAAADSVMRAVAEDSSLACLRTSDYTVDFHERWMSAMRTVLKLLQTHNL